MAGWKEYRSLNKREFVPRAPSTHGFGLWDRPQGSYKWYRELKAWMRRPVGAARRGWQASRGGRARRCGPIWM